MAKPQKLDLFRQHKEEYAASKARPQLVRVAPARYLAADGAGEPGGQAFGEKTAGLYAAAFTIKMAGKAAGKADYKVGPLEALWWTEPDGSFRPATPRRLWQWKLLIRTPEFVASADLAAAKDSLRAKGKPAAFEDVRLETIEEGRCAQMLHVGPYEAIGETVRRIMELLAREGLQPAGRYHEVYLSDPRRVDPAKLRTIVRLPACPAGGA